MVTAVEAWLQPMAVEKYLGDHDDAQQNFNNSSGYDSQTGIYHSLLKLGYDYEIPPQLELDAATFVLSQFPGAGFAEWRVAYIDSETKQRITYAELRRAFHSLASGLCYALDVRKGDVVFVLSPNSLLYPIICLAVLSIGAVLTTANPLNSISEISKQVRDSRAKLAISTPEELHKLIPTGVPVVLTSRPDDGVMLSVQELIECYNTEPLDIPRVSIAQSDTAAILYSSGTRGTSKGVVLTHANFISSMTLLRWSVDVTSSHDDVFLCFLPMFHIYGLAFFGLGLLCSGITTVLMQKFDFIAMLDAIQEYRVSNIPAVPPVILALVKYSNQAGRDLSSLRRIGSGAAPLSKELAIAFRQMFPWVELRPGYGLTESCGATSYFVYDRDSKVRPASCGRLLPTFCAKVIDPDTGKALPPLKEGELWIKSPSVMKEYLGNMEATAATFDLSGWLKTGDLCYFDEDGFLYIVDRIKEHKKHNSYQMSVYKKVRRVMSFISDVPKSAAGKILRKDLVLKSKHQFNSKV